MGCRRRLSWFQGLQKESLIVRDGTLEVAVAPQERHQVC